MPRRPMMLFTEKYSDKIFGVLHCFDRIIIQGTIPGICYACGMTSYLYANKIKIFDYPKFANFYCPVIKYFYMGYHWSIMQVEYATDVIFKRQKDLKLIYGSLTRTAIHSVKPENIATFLGKNYHLYIKMKWVINFLQE